MAGRAPPGDAGDGGRLPWTTGYGAPPDAQAATYNDDPRHPDHPRHAEHRAGYNMLIFAVAIMCVFCSIGLAVTSVTSFIYLEEEMGRYNDCTYSAVCGKTEQQASNNPAAARAAAMYGTAQEGDERSGTITTAAPHNTATLADEAHNTATLADEARGER